MTKSQTQMAGTEIPNVLGADKAADPNLKPETKVKREGIPKAKPVVPKSVSLFKG